MSQIVSVESGKLAPMTGYYEAIHDDGNCIILEGEKRKLLAEGTRAPKIVSCQHDVTWRLVGSY